MKTQAIKLLKKTFPSAAVNYVRIRELFKDKRAPVLTKMGFKLSGNQLMESGQFEPGETRIFEELLKSVDVVINVGANIGYYCCLALHHKKQVIAFEPIVQNVQHLLRNVQANGWSEGIEIFPIALGNQTGVIEIFGGGTGASTIKGWAGTPENYSTLVPCSTLDKVLGNRCEGQSCLVMVDIEGAEKHFLEGSKSHFELEPKPIWFVEISISAHQPAGNKFNPNLVKTFEEFWSRNYEAWTSHKENRLVTRDEVLKILETGVDTLWGDTFLFVDKNEPGHQKILEYLRRQA